MKKTFRKCPLCNEPVKHIKHKRDIDTAHVWICSKCPFVWFEFITEEELEDIKEEIKESKPSSEENSNIIKLLSIFNKYNSSVGYSNKGYRSVLSDMLSVMTFEEASDYVSYAISIQGKPYAPTINNPFDLKYKQEKIAGYLERNK